MNITFHGAVREVTGSMHLVTIGNNRILLDCGLFQGRRKETARKNRILPFDPAIVTNVVLSHAHIDHSGRLPMLTSKGFTGQIFCTRPTADACRYLLPDSAHIQESDADYLNYKVVRSHLHSIDASSRGRKSKKRRSGIRKLLKTKGHHLNRDKMDELIEKHRLESVRPLYTKEDAEGSLDHLEGIPYRHEVAIGEEASCTLYEAGHILGSAISIIRAQENGRKVTIGYTGDIGRFGKPIIRDPALNFAEEHRDIDLLIMESTYGDRNHDEVAELKPQLEAVLSGTYGRGGTIIIPAFAFGRTQELLYILHELYSEGKVTQVPVYVDSPLATRITQVFGEHPEVYDRDAHKTFLKNGRNPFSFKEGHFVASVEESMALNRDETPHIVIAASGMCEAGRVLHHLRHKIHNPKHTILIVGFMAANTLGRRILEQGEQYDAAGRKGDPPLLKFLNKHYPLKAHVSRIGGFSAHGDRDEMVRFLKQSNLRVKKIAVVHGEEDQSLAFADLLRKEGYSSMVPRIGESITVS